MNSGPHCWHSFTSRCKWVDLKFTLCVLCLDTLMLYLCWGLFSLQQKNLCLNGSALKVAPAAFNGPQTRLDPWLSSAPILCIQMERNQPVWQFSVLTLSGCIHCIYNDLVLRGQSRKKKIPIAHFGVLKWHPKKSFIIFICIGTF